MDILQQLEKELQPSDLDWFDDDLIYDEEEYEDYRD